MLLLMNKRYTHTDEAGVRWRFEGGRPVSEIADKAMTCIAPIRKPKPKKKGTRK